VERTIGIDLGDVRSHYCALNEEGDVVDGGRVRTTPERVEKWFTDVPPARLGVIRAVWWGGDRGAGWGRIWFVGGNGRVHLGGTGSLRISARGTGEALPGTAARYCDGGTGWSPGPAPGFLCAPGGGTERLAAKERVRGPGVHLANH
jgi:hypothetical protein